MIKIEHIAIWTTELEKMRSFYCHYFQMTSGEKYVNKVKKFESYFLSCGDGARIELMYQPEISPQKPDANLKSQGLAHLAISVGSEEQVVALTEEIRTAGYPILSEPRRTGDGYFESCILDPDNNPIEITT